MRVTLQEYFFQISFGVVTATVSPGCNALLEFASDEDGLSHDMGKEESLKSPKDWQGETIWNTRTRSTKIVCNAVIHIFHDGNNCDSFEIVVISTEY